MVVALLGCRPRATDSVLDRYPLPRVAAEQPQYRGTWIGPELSLSFVGPWVFVRPSAEPERAPIELRVSVERREGDAYALRTSVAEVWPAAFLRPSDWTMLVEDGQLAIAMGDEALAAYVAAEPWPVLQGPAMLAEIGEIGVELTEPGLADGVACLELANDRCVELEGGGPLASGCRELHWALCLSALGPGPIDPIARAAEAIARDIHHHLLELRYAEAVVLHATPDQRDAAQRLLTRARTRASARLDAIADAGPLPAEDPHLEELLARLGR